MVKKILDLVRETKILRVRDLTERGIHPEYIRRLVREGWLVKLNRGTYALPDAKHSEHQSLIEVLVRVPNGVACLLTALQFHQIGTQSPRAVWIALDRRAAEPRLTSPRVRIVRFSGEALTAGIETHRVDNIPIRVYNAAKTVADCFKYRHKIGLDVAQEAIRDCLRQRKCTVDDLWRYAKICRVTNAIRPYLEGAL